mgnify:FL=1
MQIDAIMNGIVLDHIKAGNSMNIYSVLRLDELDCSVAIIQNADSVKMGKKDILKIDALIDINFDVLGYLDPGVTVNIIKDGKIENRLHLELPKTVEGVIKCKNPRCITSIEQELPHRFKLVDPQKRLYRCVYCEAAAKNEDAM